MATGFVQRFKGKVAFQTISLPSGGFVDANSGTSGSLQGMLRIPIQAVAALTTDYSGAVPPGATILSAAFYCSTAFTGATVTLMLGNAAGNASYVAAVDIKTPGIAVTPLTMLNAQAGAFLAMPALVSGKNLWARITQTATTTAVGTGAVVIEYAL